MIAAPASVSAAAGLGLGELAEVLQLSRAGSLLRDRFHDRDFEPPRQLISDLVKRLNATRSGRRRGNDDIEPDAPRANELLGDNADLAQRGRVVSNSPTSVRWVSNCSRPNSSWP